MKINLESMKDLARKLDYSSATLYGVTADDVCSMAYQLQYFFEAMEKIKKQRISADGWENFEYRSGLKCAEDKLNNALIDKEDEYTLDA